MTRLTNTIQRLRCRIESATRREGPRPLLSIETVLLVLSVVYGGGMRLRAHLYEKEVLPTKTLPCRVVSIGNIIAGGTGKTPMTILVAQCINDLGCRVVVISRGYRGGMEDRGGIVSDGQTIFKGPEDAGDEPYLMANVLKGIPVVVGRRRFDAGMLAVERFKPDVIVLDDAFQHMRLQRDLNLVLLDSRSPFANGYLLPRGLLREPVSALRRAHAIVFTRCSPTVPPAIRDGLPANRPVFYTDHIPVIRRTDKGENTSLNATLDMSNLEGKKAVAFAGLADNDQFFESLEQAGCNLAHTFSFDDHHRYAGRDLDRIAATAREKGADVLVTTFKDFVKIENHNRWPIELIAVDVSIQLLDDKHRFLNFIAGTL